jgi:hypothetical protein
MPVANVADYAPRLNYDESLQLLTDAYRSRFPDSKVETLSLFVVRTPLFSLMISIGRCQQESIYLNTVDGLIVLRRI